MANPPTLGEIHVREFLYKLNLPQYYERLINEGFDQMQSLFEATEEDLTAMGVKRGHRRLIQREIATAKGIPYHTPLYIDSSYQNQKEDVPSLVSADLTSQSQSSDNNKTPGMPHALRQSRLNERTMNAFLASPYVSYIQETGKSRLSNVSSTKREKFLSGRKEESAGRSVVSNTTQASSNSSAEEDCNSISDMSSMFAETPYKRKYRRHAKPDKNAPTKPISAYVMFSNKVRAELKDQNMSFANLAKIVGDRWKAISPQLKEEYEAMAAKAKEEYMHALQSYEQTQDYRNYQNYLSDFKAKQNLNQSSRKRMKPDSPNSGSMADSSSNNSNGNGNGNGNGNCNSSQSSGHSSYFDQNSNCQSYVDYKFKDSTNDYGGNGNGHNSSNSSRSFENGNFVKSSNVRSGSRYSHSSSSDPSSVSPPQYQHEQTFYRSPYPSVSTSPPESTFHTHTQAPKRPSPVLPSPTSLNNTNTSSTSVANNSSEMQLNSFNGEDRRHHHHRQ